jgi:anti-sigma regulatory factor (Ser/Thr protein kinase)
MKRKKNRSPEIRTYILENIRDHPNDISAVTQKKFGLTRPAVLRHVHALIKKGAIGVKGITRDRSYFEIPIVNKGFTFPLIPPPEEDKIWIEKVRPLLGAAKENVIRICEYGFTEMVNNAIDHSSGKNLQTIVNVTYSNIKLIVADDGIGIFTKLKEELHLDHPRDAILELYKGKLTTDPERHTGEGIFFTSRMFDKFMIASGKLSFSRDSEGRDFLLTEDYIDEEMSGTVISMEISPRSTKTTKQILDKFSADDDMGFTRTIVPVSLAKFGDENLVSRSQAKRLLTRLDKFKEIWFDFASVKTMGPAFADEIFRVYQNQHPLIKMEPIRANEDIEALIKRVKTGRNSQLADKDA